MNDPHQRPAETFFLPEHMVTASELREFLFCERAWFLNRQGYRVSSEAERHRAAGISFHRARAKAGRAGASPWPFRWATILAAAGTAILLSQFWLGRPWF
jgi:hypothetical protein